MLTEDEAANYWSARRRFRTLSDSNSKKTIDKFTREYEEAKKQVLDGMNTNVSDALQRERGEKRRLVEEVRELRRRLADGAGPP